MRGIESNYSTSRLTESSRDRYNMFLLLKAAESVHDKRQSLLVGLSLHQYCNLLSLSITDEFRHTQKLYRGSSFVGKMWNEQNPRFQCTGTAILSRKPLPNHSS